MNKALHFGAGNIGRGFIGLVLAQAGYRIDFVDVQEPLVAGLHAQKSYDVEIVGDTRTRVSVENVDARYADDPLLSECINEASLVTCAVGPLVLTHIAKPLADGIAHRLREKRNHDPLCIIACENMIRASSALKEMVYTHLDADIQKTIETLHCIRFIDSAVDRIVPQTNLDQREIESSREEPQVPLVRVEEYSEWLIEGRELPTEFTTPQGVTVVDTLDAFIERKLFTVNTAHGVTAWHGFLHGIERIDQCMKDPHIRRATELLCKETGEMLIHKHGFDRTQHAKYIDHILHRFGNSHLEDQVDRVGRAPMRKLSYNERLIAPLRYALTHGLAHEQLIFGCALCLHFRSPHDKEALQLEKLLQTNLVSNVFMQVSGLNEIGIAQKVEQEYHDISKKKKKNRSK